MHIELKRHDTHGVIHEGDYQNIRALVEHCAKNKVNMTYALLDGASLDGASLDGALLDGASLNHASLNHASLNHASLDGALLDGASLNDASLYRASLEGASLNGASLNHASLNGAYARGALLDGAEGIALTYVPGMTSYNGPVYAVDYTTHIMLKAECKWLSEADMIAHVQKIKTGTALIQCLMSIETLCRVLELSRKEVTK